MQLEKEILKEHSRVQTLRIVDWIGNDQKRFDELVHLFLNGEYRVVQRAAWPLRFCVQQHPGLVKKHLEKIIQNLHQPGLHDAVKRNTVRFLQDMEILPKLHGEVMNTCFRFIESPTEKVAVKVYCMSILQKLSMQYPDIQAELKLVIEEQLPHESAAFKSRAKKVLKKIDRS